MLKYKMTYLSMIIWLHFYISVYDSINNYYFLKVFYITWPEGLNLVEQADSSIIDSFTDTMSSTT